MRIAMVCLGNICRSPMAEAVTRALVAEAGIEDVDVCSYGTAGYHRGEPADPGALSALRRAGWPEGNHRAQQLTEATLDDADLIACADRANLAAVADLARRRGGRPPRMVLLRSFDPATGPGDDEVPDPWGGGPEAFDRSLHLIEAACRGLVTELAVSRR